MWREIIYNTNPKVLNLIVSIHSLNIMNKVKKTACGKITKVIIYQSSIGLIFLRTASGRYQVESEGAYRLNDKTTAFSSIERPFLQI